MLGLATIVRVHGAALHEFVATLDGWDVLVSIPDDAPAVHRALHDAVGCCPGPDRLRTIAVPLDDDEVLAVLAELASHPHQAGRGWGITSQILDYGESLPLRRGSAVVDLALRRPGIAPGRTDGEVRRLVRLRCAHAALGCRTRGRGPAASHT